MSNTERLLRDLVKLIDEATECRECVLMPDVFCSRTKVMRWKRLFGEAKSVLRQIDRERSAAGKKPN